MFVAVVVVVIPCVDAYADAGVDVVVYVIVIVCCCRFWLRCCWWLLLGRC